MSVKVTMYASLECPYCLRAERLLRSKGANDLTTIAVDTNPDARQAMVARSGRRSVPQIFVGAIHVGGFDDLTRLDRAGLLDRLLGSAPHADGEALSGSQ